MILAAIPAIMTLLYGLFISSLVGAIGGFFGAAAVFSPVFLIAQAIISYALSLAMTYILALLIDAFASSFGAERSKSQAMKVAAYAPTAIWVSFLATIVPLLGWLVVLAAAVYTIFVFHFGLRILMKTPEDKGPGYTAVVIVVGCVVALVLSSIVNLPLRIMRAGSIMNSVSHNVTIKLPNGQGSVNVSDAATQMKAMADQMKASADGKGPPATDPAVLAALLPGSLPGFSKTESSSSGGGVGALNASVAKTVYQKGDERIELTVSDLGAVGALAGIAKVTSSTETATSYEKVSNINGRMTTEEYHKDSNSGKYGVLVGNRFMVEADGSKAPIDDIKAAVNAVPADRLEALAKG